MQEIDLAGRLEAASPNLLLEQLSVRFGLSPDLLRHVMGRTGPALVAALMAAGATHDGAGVLFSTAMSKNVNARIAQYLPQLVSTTAGLKALESAGEAFLAQTTRISLAELSDLVASQTGVPSQAVYALSGLVAAVLAGVLKHELLLDEATLSGLPAMLAGQWPIMAPHLTDAVAALLGFDDAIAFRDHVPAQLRVLAGSLSRAVAVPATFALESAQQNHDAEAPSSERSGRRHVWLPLTVMVLSAAVLVAAVLIYIQLHSGGQISGATVTGRVQSAPASHAGAASTPTLAAAAVPTAASGNTPAAASTPAASGIPYASSPSTSPLANQAKLVISMNRDGIATIVATVSSEAEKAQLIEALDRTVGAGHVTTDVTVNTSVQPAAWLPHLDALVPLMQISHADVTIEGTRIELGGAVADASANADWADRLRTQFGPTWQVDTFNNDQAVTAATAAFRAALANLEPSAACDVQAVTRVLNLQVVDFARDSAGVPASATDNLRDTARVLKTCADRDQLIRLAIKGFSDNIGDAQAQLDLSKKRAAAIRTWLIKAGVRSESLTAQGYGATQPVSSNLTERGRFTNRRIAFDAAP